MEGFQEFLITGTCKGGGYLYARTLPLHPKANSNGLYPLHRVLVENKMKRYLLEDEVVHHKNHNKHDNSIENLLVMNNREHSRLHKEGVNEIVTNCGNCGKEISLKPFEYRLRTKRNVSHKVFCDPTCGALHQHSK